jgi:hypothetical protein
MFTAMTNITLLTWLVLAILMKVYGRNYKAFEYLVMGSHNDSGWSMLVLALGFGLVRIMLVHLYRKLLGIVHTNNNDTADQAKGDQEHDNAKPSVIVEASESAKAEEAVMTAAAMAAPATVSLAPAAENAGSGTMSEFSVFTNDTNAHEALPATEAAETAEDATTVATMAAQNNVSPADADGAATTAAATAAAANAAGAAAGAAAAAAEKSPVPDASGDAAAAVDESVVSAASAVAAEPPVSAAEGAAPAVDKISDIRQVTNTPDQSNAITTGTVNDAHPADSNTKTACTKGNFLAVCGETNTPYHITATSDTYYSVLPVRSLRT